MKSELRKIFEDLCKANDLIIENKNRSGLMPVCFIIEDNGNDKTQIKVIAFPFGSYQEKIRMKELLMKIILSNKTKGYILFLDTKMTTMNKENNVEKIQDCVIRNLCSPKLTIREAIIYDEEKRKIIEKIKVLDTDDKTETKYNGIIDEWDLYGKHFDEEDEEMNKKNEKYQKYKEDNPDKYREVG